MNDRRSHSFAGNGVYSFRFQASELLLAGDLGFVSAIVVSSMEIRRGFRKIEPAGSTYQVAAKLNCLLLDNRVPLQKSGIVPETY